MRNPFLWLFFGFSHFAKIQDGHLPKYKFGIIWDLMAVESHENTLFMGFWVWEIHFWSYFSDSAKLKNSRWPPPKKQLWDNLRLNNSRIIWKYIFCRFLSLKIPFLRLFFGFGYTGKDQDGLRPKYKYGIIRDLMVVESHENKLFVGLWVWKIHFRGYFSDSTILEKLKMDATQNTKVW